MRRLLGVCAAIAAMIGAVLPGSAQTAEQVVRGSVASAAASGGQARQAFAASGGQVNGIAGYVFSVEPSTVGDPFTLRLDDTTGFNQANITFYDAAGSACLVYAFNNPEEAGRVCGVLASVWLFYGVNATFEYRAGSGVDFGGVADRTANVEVLGRVPFTTGTDLAFEGDYAYVGSEDPSPIEGGLHIVNISTPSSPIQVGHLGCPAQQNDVAVWRGIVTMAIDSASTNNVCTPGIGQEGVRIVDARTPSAPVQVGFIADTNRGGTASAVTGGAHTLTTVGDTGYVYVNNNFGSTVDVVNLRPVLTGGRAVIAERIPVSRSGADGCHDITVDGTRAFCAAAAHTDIWDISNPLLPVVIGRVVNPLIDFHHSTAIDGNILIIGDEFTGAEAAAGCIAAGHAPPGALWFYDISVAAAPVLLSYFAPPEISPGVRCTAHNFNVIPGQRKVVASWYKLGTRVIDFSDPRFPVEVGHARGDGAVTWSSYWYRNAIFTGDLHRGMEVFSFTG